MSELTGTETRTVVVFVVLIRVILLLPHSSPLLLFKNKVTLDTLYKNEKIAQDSGPRPFEQLSAEHFKAIYKLGMEK